MPRRFLVDTMYVHNYVCAVADSGGFIGFHGNPIQK